MRKARIRSLRRQFLKEHGRPPQAAPELGSIAAQNGMVSEIRRMKKDYLRSRGAQ